MTENWIVLGDTTSSGGRMITCSPFTDADGKGVCRKGDKATCPQHNGVFPITGGCDPTTIIDGEEVALHGATLACGCKVLSTQQMRVFLDAGGGALAGTGSLAAQNPVRVDASIHVDNASSEQLGQEPLAQLFASEAEDETCEEKFKKVSKIVLRNEGGFVDDPDDAGGATNMGIAWPTWQQFAKIDLGVEPTLENLKSLTEDQAEIIYRKRYWEPKGFCSIDDPRVALMIYDWTITSGKAVREVQQVLSSKFGKAVVADNAMGSATIAAINGVEDQDELISEIARSRKDYYRSLTFNRDGSRNSNQKFLNGWLNRVDRCLEIVR